MTTSLRSGSIAGLGFGLLLLGMLALPGISSGQDIDDIFTTTVTGSTVTVNHLNAMYNCAQDSITCSTEWAGGDLIATELEIPPGGLADCICYFDLYFELTDLPPGPLTIRWTYLDSDGSGWTEILLDVVVGDDGQDGLVGFVPVEQSECHSGHAVGEEETEWGQIRMWYR